MRSIRLACWALAALCCSAEAAPIICSTGEATATTAGCGAAIQSPASNNLLPDGNWYVSSNSSGTFLGQAYVTVNNAYPLQNAGPWLSDSAVSSWITPSNNQNAQYVNGSTIYLSTQFVVGATTDLASLVVTGSWLADDYGSGVYLNGVAVAQSALPAFGGEGGPMVAFSVSGGDPLQGQAAFVVGTNTLTFAFVNDGTDHGTLIAPRTSPSGARIEIASMGSPPTVADVPEPGQLALFLAGAVGFLVARRRREGRLARQRS